MIEAILVRRLSLITLLLAAGISAAAFASGSPRIAGGVAAGAGLGLLPILTWSFLGAMWIQAKPAVARQELNDRDRSSAKAGPALFGALTLAKLLLYAAALYFLVGRNLVDPLAFAGALLAPSLLFGALSLRRGAAL